MHPENKLHILVDADACPRVIKEILFRAAKREKIHTTFVANLPLKIPKSEYLKSLLVAGGFDVADEHIIEMVNPGDLVITADIPMAAKIVEKGATGLNPRGYFYHPDNIQEALTMRNLKQELRGSGVETGGPSAFSMNDRENFANKLDRFLRENKNK